MPVNKKQRPVTVFIAVYGSLKDGFYNRLRFENYYPGEIISHGFHRVSNLSLINLELGYPACIKTQSKQDTVEVELLEVTPRIHRSIDLMEFGAGYYPETILIEGRVCTIYLMKDTDISEFQLLNNVIQDGIWKEQNEKQTIY